MYFTIFLKLLKFTFLKIPYVSPVFTSLSPSLKFLSYHPQLLKLMASSLRKIITYMHINSLTNCLKVTYYCSYVFSTDLSGLANLPGVLSLWKTDSHFPATISCCSSPMEEAPCDLLIHAGLMIRIVQADKLCDFLAVASLAYIEDTNV